MNNENILLFESQSSNSSNNRGGLLKFIISSTINLFIITCFIFISMNISKKYKANINKSYKKKINNSLRFLQGNNNKPQIKRQNTFSSKNNVIEEEMKKYLNLLLESLDSRFDFLREIISGKQFIITKDSYFFEKQKQIFVSRLIKNVYSGTWEYFPYFPQDEDNNHKKNISLSQYNYLNSNKKKFKIGNCQSGEVNFSFKRAIEMSTKQEALALSMKNLEGNYIDNWIQHISYAKIRDLNRTIDNERNLYIVKGEFSTSMIKGKLLSSIKFNTKKSQCSTYVEMEFPLTQVLLRTTLNNNSTTFEKNISTIDPKNFTMVLSSMCGFRIKIKAKIYDYVNSYFEKKKKINYYSFFCLTSSILYLIGTFGLTCSLNSNENVISAISLETFCQNIVWHLYCGILNINFGIFNYSEYFGNFCIVALFPMINFVLVDLRFLYFYWKIKKRLLNDRQFIKLRLKFFLVFYVLLLISFLSFSFFYTNKIYISALAIFLWTPQIIYNIVNNNKYIYPTFYIIANTLDRIVYPFYFRGFKNNFAQLKSDINLILILSIYILMTIIILYLQVFFGSRFMLSSKYQKKNFDFHKTKGELLKERPDSIKEECVICLTPLIEEEDQKNEINNKANDNKKQEDIIAKNNEQERRTSEMETKMNIDNIKSTNSSIDFINNTINQQNLNIIRDNKKNLKKEIYLSQNNNISLTIIEVNNTKKMILNKKHNNFTFKIIGKILKIIFCENFFKFYKFRKILKEKKYMIFPCGHIFHSECIEKWFERKKECPSCRASMEEYL